MELGALEFLFIAIGLVTLLYYYLTWNFDHWESRGVKGPKPTVLLGNVKDVVKNKYSMGSYVDTVYNQWKSEPYAGIFLRSKPILVLHDLDLIKNVLIRNFSQFAERGCELHDKVEPLSAHLFHLESRRWRPLRLKLSLVFTSGRLKEMFYLLEECAQHFVEYVGKLVCDANGEHGTNLEFRDLTAKFTTDVIGVCAFGLQMNAMEDENSPFRDMGKRVFARNWRKLVQFRLRAMAPILYGIIGRFFVDQEMNNFFIGTMRRTMDYRKSNGVVKHDFIDLLMAIRDHPDQMADIELTDNLLAAQLFGFFIAGFETSSSTMSHAFYELALNPKVQIKLRKEIKEVTNSTGRTIDYETIKSMQYLDMVFQETLRKYPPVTVLHRKATEPYTFTDTSNKKLLTIEKGQIIWIPCYSLQHDPRYFPNPELFDPERFTEAAIKSRHPMTYLPFGDGPRNCIGKRFGVMQTKVGLFKILQHYRVEPCEKTTIPYEVDPAAFLLAPKGGIHLKIIRDNPDTDL